jgi:hypothetical protein
MKRGPKGREKGGISLPVSERERERESDYLYIDKPGIEEKVENVGEKTKREGEGFPPSLILNLILQLLYILFNFVPFTSLKNWITRITNLGISLKLSWHGIHECNIVFMNTVIAFMTKRIRLHNCSDALLGIVCDGGFTSRSFVIPNLVASTIGNDLGL